MKYLVVFFGLLLAYTLIYAGVSKLMPALTLVESAGSA